MDRLSVPTISRSDPRYEKLAANDPELDSGDEGTITPSTHDPSWREGGRQRRRTLLSTLWICTRVVLITASIVAWGSSLWLTHVASQELGQARSLIAGLRGGMPGLGSDDGSSHQQHPGTHPHQQPPGPPPPSGPDRHGAAAPNVPLIPGGGTLPVPGYGLAFNTSYCNGWADPAGARARGCVLDPSQGGWVHELCHDPELLAEWLRLPDFGWYLDPHRRQRIAQDRVWAADGLPRGVHGTILYTGLEFHLQHCKFVLRLRIKNGMRANRGLGYLPLDPGHMYHCVHLMTEDSTPESRAKELTQVVLGNFGGGTEGFGLAGECYVPVA